MCQSNDTMNIPNFPAELIEHIITFLPVKSQFRVANALRFLHIRDSCIPYLPFASMNNASKKGQIELLQWWKDSGKRCEYNDFAMDYASLNGHVHILQWWIESGLECKYSVFAMDWASQNGHVHILQWWWDKRDFELKYSNVAIDHASENGHVEVLEWWEDY